MWIQKAATTIRWEHSSMLCVSCAALTFVGVVGCGEKPAPKPKAPVNSVPQLPPSVPIVQPPKPSPSPKSSKSADASKSKQKPLPPGTDPNSIFEIAAVNQPLNVEPSKGNPDDQFVVESGKPGVNSTQFVVASVPKLTLGTAKQGFSLPSGFTAITGSGYSEAGLPLQIRCDKLESVLVLVPAGPVNIGTNDGPIECQPEFSVHLDAYYIQMFEVTVAEFEKYRTEQKDKKRAVPTTLNTTTNPKFPVLGVQWAVAGTFARWVGMDLPTEAELEKGARGPNSLRTPWGDGRAIWATPRQTTTITAVGSYATDKSPYGAYDLAGNALEWCSDLYSEQAHKDALATSSVAPHNWAGPKKVPNGNLRVVKGNGPDWSAWHRQGRDIGKGFPDVGFRCVLRISTPTPKAGT